MVKKSKFKKIAPILLAGGILALNSELTVSADEYSKVLSQDAIQTAIQCGQLHLEEYNGTLENVDVFYIYQENGGEKAVQEIVNTSSKNNIENSDKGSSGVVNSVNSAVSGLLPNTGEGEINWILTGLGVGTLTFAGYMVYRHKKSGKLFLAALVIAGGMTVTNNSALAEEVKECFEKTFYLSAKDYDGSDKYTYLGYVVYEKNTETVKETPVEPKETENETVVTEEVSTIWKDTDGNVLKHKESGSKEVGEIEGYVFIRTDYDEKGNVSHIFLKIPDPEIKEVIKEIVKEVPVEKLVEVIKEVPVEVIREVEVEKIVETHTEKETTNESVYGAVMVHYVRVSDGATIATDVFDTEYVKIGTKVKTKETTADGTVTENTEFISDGVAYDTTDYKPESIDFAGDTYTLVGLKSGNEVGEVVEGVLHITYEYDLVTPEVNPWTIWKVQGTGEVLRNQEYGTLAPDTFENYEFVETTVDGEGNTTHWYKLKEQQSEDNEDPEVTTPSEETTLVHEVEFEDEE